MVSQSIVNIISKSKKYFDTVTCFLSDFSANIALQFTVLFLKRPETGLPKAKPTALGDHIKPFSPESGTKNNIVYM